jgi:hypothetical protein
MKKVNQNYIGASSPQPQEDLPPRLNPDAISLWKEIVQDYDDVSWEFAISHFIRLCGNHQLPATSVKNAHGDRLYIANQLLRKRFKFLTIIKRTNLYKDFGLLLTRHHNVTKFLVDYDSTKIYVKNAAKPLTLDIRKFRQIQLKLIHDHEFKFTGYGDMYKKIDDGFILKANMGSGTGPYSLQFSYLITIDRPWHTKYMTYFEQDLQLAKLWATIIAHKTPHQHKFLRF